MVTGPEELHHSEKYLQLKMKSITEILFQIDHFATFEREIKITFEREIKITLERKIKTTKITLSTFS